ncbi:sigma-54-dependent Fis family transcriptional regulator [Babesia caballi]|uniref:Sigma-54-dependent Fis family transcriptional regulator n=1 Tax=Babesia caballi TaxID=5871 RepID=A0AAV4LRT2_BABCB|nr:sigma-54-dependent Fis family transcriptional regulator [Babesia caballi]
MTAAGFRLLALGLVAAARLAWANQYTFTLPMYVKTFSRYYSYTGSNSNSEFLDQFDPLVANMMMNARKVVTDNARAVLDASIFDQETSDSALAATSSAVLNEMWARDLFNDNHLYKMEYILQHYRGASEQLLKVPVENPAFYDAPFDEPLDKMVLYYWAFHLKQTYDALMENASEMHVKLEHVKESVNTSVHPSD